MDGCDGRHLRAVGGGRRRPKAGAGPAAAKQLVQLRLIHLRMLGNSGCQRATNTHLCAHKGRRLAPARICLLHLISPRGGQSGSRCLSVHCHTTSACIRPPARACALRLDADPEMKRCCGSGARTASREARAGNVQTSQQRTSEMCVGTGRHTSTSSMAPPWANRRPVIRIQGGMQHACK